MTIKMKQKPLGQKLLAWGSVSFINGQIFGMTNSGEEVLLLDQVLLQTDLSKENSEAIAKLSAKSGRDEGRIAGDVTITIPENGLIDKASFVGQGRLTVTNWNLEELLPLAALFSDQVPFGSGRLDGEWRMENPSDRELKITGAFKAKDVVLYGGLFKKDQPEIAQIDCQLNIFRQEGQWSLKKLQFTSPLASGTASGFREEEVTLDTRVNIVPTLKQLPNTLNIRDDLQITNGVIKVSGKVALTDEGTHFDGRLTLSRLEGQQARRKFAWKKPLTITGQGRYKDDRWAIDQAKIASTFINGEVRATPDQFESRLIVDAAKTFKQAGQIFKLPPIALQGFMKADLTAQKRGTLWDLHIDISSEALEVHSTEKILSATAPFNLQGESQYQIKNRRHLLTAPQLSIKSDLLDGIYTADQIELLPGGRMVKMESATAIGKIDNGKLGAVYAAIEGVQPKLDDFG